MNFFKLLSSEFEQPDYKDLYENHSHKSQMIKLAAVISFIPKVETLKRTTKA
jgi:hypothetical protein